jgi:L-ascorbate metabolism protein UlaG (beta-lactamase superfamily)
MSQRKSAVLLKMQSLGTLVGESAFRPMTGESKVPTLVDDHELGITFIGHSSFFIQIGGRNLLIDPVFVERLIALRRLRRPGSTIKDLPAVDMVLLSHAHMDHLNRPSLRRIVAHTVRMTGRATKTISGLDVTMTPCKHWGARFFKDTHRGFGGYVIRGGGHTLYHSGDTAYFDGFRKIGERLKPEVALLPIGAYSPDNYRGVHTSPEEALQAFLDVGAQRMIPMHYGTFRLSQEPMDEPVQRLMEAARRAGVADSVCVLPEGDTDVTSVNEPRLAVR